ncbi:MAG: hypothetical protein WA964_15670, partial [Ilumatobacter sp.]
ATHVASTAGSVTLGAPNDAHRAKCEQHREAVEKALSAHTGSPVAVELVVDGEGGGVGGGESPSPAPTGEPASAAPAPAGEPASPSPAANPSPAPAPSAAAAPGATATSDAPAVRSTTGALAHDSDPAPQASPDPARLSVVPVAEPAPPAVEPALDSEALQTPDSEAPPTPVLNGRAIADHARSQGPAPDPDEGLQRLADSLPDDDDVDIDDLVDAPPETVKTPIDRLAEAFPGSEMVDDQY